MKCAGFALEEDKSSRLLRRPRPRPRPLPRPLERGGSSFCAEFTWGGSGALNIGNTGLVSDEEALERFPRPRPRPRPLPLLLLPGGEVGGMEVGGMAAVAIEAIIG